MTRRRLHEQASFETNSVTPKSLPVRKCSFIQGYHVEYMARFRSAGRFRRRQMMRRARRIVRKVSGITLAKRVLLNQVSIPDVSASDFDNEVEIPLVETLSTVDEEVESDGAGAIADVPVYSRMTGIRANFIIEHSNAHFVRWMLYKEPDGESLVTDMSSQFHTSDDTPTARELRKYTLAKGLLHIGADRQAANLRIRVSRAAMRRCSPMRLNDRITLVLAKSAAGTASTISGFATLYFKANA